MLFNIRLKELHLYLSDIIILTLKQAEPVGNFIAPQCLHNWNLRETLRSDVLWVEFIVAGCLKNVKKKKSSAVYIQNTCQFKEKGVFITQMDSFRGLLNPASQY